VSGSVYPRTIPFLACVSVEDMVDVLNDEGLSVQLVAEEDGGFFTSAAPSATRYRRRTDGSSGTA